MSVDPQPRSGIEPLFDWDNMKHALYRKFSMNAAKGLVASLMFALIVVGCASKSDSVPEESRLAEADLFDGLKDEAASVTTSYSEDPTEALIPAEDSPKLSELPMSIFDEKIPEEYHFFKHARLSSLELETLLGIGHQLKSH